MPLIATTLADALNKIGPLGSDPEAAAAWATAFLNYFSNAMAGPTPAVKPSILGLKGLMASAMLGISAPGAGPQKIQDGITAVWAALAPMTTAVFPGTTPPLTPPPGNSTIAAAILAIVPANTGGNVPRNGSMNLLATAIHSTQLGGTTTLASIPPAPVPIL